MKKFIVAVVALAVVAMAGKAMAADTANLTVNATVVGTCVINSAPTINLYLDPAVVADGTGSGLIDFTCSNGTIYTLSGPAASTLTGPGSINYTLAYTNTAGTGTGLSQTSTASVIVPYALFSVAPAGVYTDTVVVSIIP